MSTLPNGKNAIVYGGGGDDVGASVPSTFAREGAKVFLVGRTSASLEAAAGAMTNVTAGFVLR